MGIASSYVRFKRAALMECAPVFPSWELRNRMSRPRSHGPAKLVHHQLIARKEKSRTNPSNLRSHLA
jgi:hypothetical protein